MTIRCSAILLLSAAIVAAQPTAGNPQVDSVFSSFTRETPGCAVGVSRDGTVVFRGGYGMADLERNVPITPDSVFESGSVAKQFTAAALMLLAQSGKISLDGPLRKYLPELPDYGTPVTIRHVIHHISGLREWRPIAQFSGFPEGSRVYTNADLLEFASRQRGLNFDPGTNYTYSNTGFNIAAILIERVLGGKTFPAFTKEAIFDPLGMTHTRWRDNFRAIIPGRAVAYKRVAGTWEIAMPIENIIGAGGMLTTVDDLLRWNDNFRHAKVGGPEFVAAQQKQAVLASGRAIAYAAGLVVGTVGGLREVSHGGATGGYRTWLGRYPEKTVSVAVLCNAANINPTNLGRRTARIFTGASEDIPPHTTASESGAWLPGVYRRVRDNTIIRVEVTDGQFALARGLGNEASRTKLYAMGAGRLAVDNSTEQLVCEQSTPVRCRSTADDASVYERAELIAPTAAELSAYAGDFRSDETLGTMRVSVVGGALRYKVGAKEEGALTPTFRDTFQAPDGTAFRFIRDGAGAVNAVSTGSDRVWDLRFNRVQ